MSVVKWKALELLRILGSSGHAGPETRLLHFLPDVFVFELEDYHIQQFKRVAFG